MMRNKLPLLLLAALALSHAAWGSPATLYEVEMMVAEQSSPPQATVLSKALRQAVVKVTGSRAAAANPAFGEALRAPERYVQQYNYRTNDTSKAAQLPLQLAVSFEKGAIEGLILEAGLAVWSEPRPLTLVWLGVEQGGQKLLVGANDHGQVREMLKEAASRRGLPIRLPLLDTTDRSRLGPSHVWSEGHESLRQASQRYEAEAVLVGELAPASGGRWAIGWTLYQEGHSQRWHQSGEKIELLVAYGIDAATDALARASSVASSGQGAGGDAVYWSVSGVADMQGQRRLMEYVASLPGVSDVQLMQVSSDTIRLRISINERENMLQQLTTDSRLLPLTVPPNYTTLATTGDQLFRFAP